MSFSDMTVVKQEEEGKVHSMRGNWCEVFVIRCPLSHLYRFCKIYYVYFELLLPYGLVSYSASKVCKCIVRNCDLTAIMY